MNHELIQRVEDGMEYPDGHIEWEPQQPQRVPSENRTRLLRRDADYPTGDDGWKITPHTCRYVDIDGVRYPLWQRYCWDDARAYT